MKNKFFARAYIFEKEDKTRDILIKNAQINKLKKIEYFSDANFHKISNFLKKIPKKLFF